MEQNGSEQSKARSIAEAWRNGVRLLREAGVGEEEANAEELLLHLLGIGKAELLRDWREPFPGGRGAEWERLLERKAAGEPVQYIVGRQAFYGRWFAVKPGVLIPRPETELLAEAVLEAARALEGEGGEPPTALDVGTGSGALAVTLAAERPAWRVIASDLSEEALEVARGNAEANGVGERIAFVRGDLLEPFVEGGEDGEASRGSEGRHGARGNDGAAAAEAGLRAESGDNGRGAGMRHGGGAADILVSNPPYIPSADLAGLQREVRDHEPRLALDGGPDGLAPYRRMAARLSLLPRPPRLVAWEVGLGQAEEAAELLRAAARWDRVWFVKDYAGIDRHVLAIRGSDVR